MRPLNNKNMNSILKLAFCLTGALLLTLSCNGSNKTKTNEEKTMEQKKTLVVYFSYTAGNTKGIAEKVAKALGADIAPLEPVNPYSKDYDHVVQQGEEEVQRGYRPKLKPLGANVADYDRIVVGSPTWWYAPAPVVMSFLEGTNLKGKTVVPFMTNAGWPGHVIKDMTQAAEKSGATVEHAHEFRFSSDPSHFSQMKTTEAELDRWIASLKVGSTH